MPGIDSLVGNRADLFANNPQGLQQRYAQSQDLLDLLALQKLKTDKEAAARNMQMQMQAPAGTVKDQREQQLLDMTKREIAQQVAPGLAMQGQRMAAAQPPRQARPTPTGVAALPAPNMSPQMMAGGGIVAFQEGGMPQQPPAESQMDIDIRMYQAARRVANDQNATAEARRRAQMEMERIKNQLGSPNAIAKFFQTMDERNQYPGLARGGAVRKYAGEEGSEVVGRRNPFNLRDYGQDWQGQVGSDAGFVAFEDEAYGARAADKLLENYGRSGANTLQDVIAKFAPPNENDTSAYIDFVSRRTGIDPTESIDLEDPLTRATVLSAMGKMESGYDKSPTELLDMISSTEGRPQYSSLAPADVPQVGVRDRNSRASDTEKRGFEASDFAGLAAAAALSADKIPDLIRRVPALARKAQPYLSSARARLPAGFMPATRAVAKKVVAPMISAYETSQTSTPEYRERFGLDPNKSTSFASDLGIRGLGALSDLVNVYGFGFPGLMYSDKRRSETTPSGRITTGPTIEQAHPGGLPTPKAEPAPEAPPPPPERKREIDWDLLAAGLANMGGRPKGRVAGSFARGVMGEKQRREEAQLERDKLAAAEYGAELDYNAAIQKLAADQGISASEISDKAETYRNQFTDNGLRQQIAQQVQQERRYSDADMRDQVVLDEIERRFNKAVDMAVYNDLAVTYKYSYGDSGGESTPDMLAADAIIEGV
jgi:hypothetical protein